MGLFYINRKLKRKEEHDNERNECAGTETEGFVGGVFPERQRKQPDPKRN
jgi:hypothetical protein